MAPNILTPVFDKDLLKAVIKFQKRNFIKDDGVIGKETARLLNEAAKRTLSYIDISLSKWEEILWKKEDKFILVNVPTYSLFGVEDGVLGHTQKIIVGKPARSTPEMITSLKRAVLKPYWGVPPGILFQDKLPLIKEDALYLTRLNYEVIDTKKGEKINPLEVDWSGISKKNMPYIIRQKPGKENALGLVKFELDNPYLIFLHDTPNRKLFEKPQRALSSGCVRLSRATELGRWIFKDYQKYQDSVWDSVDRLSGTRFLESPSNLKVVITYIPIWVNEGMIWLSDDPYKVVSKVAEQTSKTQ